MRRIVRGNKKTPESVKLGRFVMLDSRSSREWRGSSCDYWRSSSAV